MHRALPLLLVAVLAAPATWAQTSEGTITTTADPEELVVDYALHIGEDAPRQSFTVHVTGEIQCAPGTDPPFPAGIRLNGPTKRTIQDDEQVEYYALGGPHSFGAPWQDAGDGRYVIDHEVDITVYSNATNPTDSDQALELRWEGAWAEEETTRCNPAGYGWNVDATTQTIVLPAIKGDPDPFPDPTGSNGTPLGTWVPWVALAAALALVRRR